MIASKCPINFLLARERFVKTKVIVRVPLRSPRAGRKLGRHSDES